MIRLIKRVNRFGSRKMHTPLYFNRPLYRPDIDGLRALAVVSVMIYHLNPDWLPGGFIGVDIFFVISGFVITNSLAQNQSQNAGQFISQFYARRLARIMPALLVMLLATVIVATLFIPKAWLSLLGEQTARYAFFGLSNLVLQTNHDEYFAPRAEFNPYTHTWSLGVEEQYYLIVPILIFFWLNALRTQNQAAQKRAAFIFILLSILSIVLCLWSTTQYPTLAFYSIATRFWELASGSILFLLSLQYAPYFHALIVKAKGQKIALLSALLGTIFLSIGLVFSQANQFPWPWVLLPVLGTLILIGGSTFTPSDPIRKFFGNAVLLWLGKRSYSLYLWHWPVYVLLRWTTGLSTPAQYLFALGGTLLLAIISYRFIEQPLRHNPWIEKRPAWIAVIGFLILTVLSFFTAKHILKHPERYSLSTVMKNQQDWYQNSLVIYPNMGKYECLPLRTNESAWGGHVIRFTPKPNCGQNDIGKNQIFVLGDSHAEALFPTIEALSAQFSFTAHIYTQGGCSFLDLKKPMEIGISQLCNHFNRLAQEDVLKRARPGDLVLLPSLRMERFTDQWVNFSVGDMHEKMYGSEAMLLRKSALLDAKSWLKPFSDANLKVIMVAPLPILKSPTFRCSDWFNQTNPICKSGLEIERSELNALRSPILKELDALSKALPNVLIWDPFLALCPEKICRSHRNEIPLFFDGDHLSNYGNFIVYENLRDWLNEYRLINKN